MSAGRPVMIAAGGTGGHLFPAEALAHALGRRGVPVVLVTDRRGERYRAGFPARSVHLVEADTVRGRSALSLARTGLALTRGYLASSWILGQERPRAVVGFGGYPTLPPLAAAASLLFPVLVHEQNAVLGRANKLLARAARRVATGFPAVDVPGGKGAFVGNPVRPAVLAAAGKPYPEREAGDPFRLLAFGGSQGARVMAEIVPAALAAMRPETRGHVHLTLQAREEDVAAARDALAGLGLDFEVAPFFPDLPMRMAASHLVIARSGASTVAELAIIGRPAILVPLPHALDNDQTANARALSDAGGALLMPQAAFTPERLAGELERLIGAPQALAAMAEAAKSLGRPDAAERLADLVLDLGAPKTKEISP